MIRVEEKSEELISGPGFCARFSSAKVLSKIVKNRQKMVSITKTGLKKKCFSIS